MRPQGSLQILRQLVGRVLADVSIVLVDVSSVLADVSSVRANISGAGTRGADPKKCQISTSAGQRGVLT